MIEILKADDFSGGLYYKIVCYLIKQKDSPELSFLMTLSLEDFYLELESVIFLGGTLPETDNSRTYFQQQKAWIHICSLAS